MYVCASRKTRGVSLKSTPLFSDCCICMFQVKAGRRIRLLVPTVLGRKLIAGLKAIDEQLVLPTKRAQLENELNHIATSCNMGKHDEIKKKFDQVRYFTVVCTLYLYSVCMYCIFLGKGKVFGNLP